MTSPPELRSAASALRAIASTLDVRADAVATAREDATTHLDALVTAAQAPDARHLASRGTATLAHARTAPAALADAAGALRVGAGEAESLATQLEGALRRAAMARTDLWRAAEAGSDPADAERRLRAAEAEASGLREEWLRRCAALATTLAGAHGELGRIAGRLTLDHLGRPVERTMRTLSNLDAVRGASAQVVTVARRAPSTARYVRAVDGLVSRRAAPATTRRGPRTDLHRARRGDQPARSHPPRPGPASNGAPVASAPGRLDRAGQRISTLTRHPVVDGLSRRVLTPVGMVASADDARRDLAAGDHASAALNTGAVLAAGATFFPPTAVAGAVALGGITVWQHRDSIRDGARRAAGRIRAGIDEVFG